MPAMIAADRKPHDAIVQLRVSRIQSFDSASPDKHRADRKRERHRHPHVAEVQQRRMHRHQNVVLQQRIRPRTIGRNRKHVAGTDSPGRRAESRRTARRTAAPSPHTGRDCPAARRLIETTRQRVERQHPSPEENRPLERAPQRNDRVEQRRRTAAHLRHVRHREVVRHQRHEHRDRRRPSPAAKLAYTAPYAIEPVTAARACTAMGTIKIPSTMNGMRDEQRARAQRDRSRSRPPSSASCTSPAASRPASAGDTRSSVSP